MWDANCKYKVSFWLGGPSHFDCEFCTSKCFWDLHSVTVFFCYWKLIVNFVRWICIYIAFSPGDLCTSFWCFIRYASELFSSVLSFSKSFIKWFFDLYAKRYTIELFSSVLSVSKSCIIWFFDLCAKRHAIELFSSVTSFSRSFIIWFFDLYAKRYTIELLSSVCLKLQ